MNVSIRRSSVGDDSLAGPSEPHDPRSLPLPQQIALLTLLGGELAQACISRLRAEGAPSPSELDYIALAQTGLSVRYSGNRRALTPIGRYRAGDLAKAIAQANSIHVVSYGEARGCRFVRCSCGEFFTSKATAIPSAALKVMRAGAKHLRLVESRTGLLPRSPAASVIPTPALAGPGRDGEPRGDGRLQ